MKLLRGFSSLLSAALCIWPASLLHAQTTNLAATPPMGWNSWNHFHNKVDDATIRAQAEAMVSSGMRDAGYIYVNIDDTWEGERDAQRRDPCQQQISRYEGACRLRPQQRVKIGIYSSPGPKTCAKFEGSYGHELQDAQTYAAWGIDYLKYDLCGLREQMKAAGFALKRRTRSWWTLTSRCVTPCGVPVVRSSTASANMATMQCGSGAQALAGTSGVPPAISTTTTREWRRSGSARRAVALRESGTLERS